MTQPEPADPLVGTWHFSELYVENFQEPDVVWDFSHGVVTWWPYDDPYVSTIQPVDFFYYFYSDGTVKLTAFKPNPPTSRDTVFFGGFEGDYRIDGEILHLRPDIWEGHRQFFYSVTEDSLILHGLVPEFCWKLERYN
ncbi:MAG: hypothetical protein ABIK96_12605 [bacterium]